MGIFDFYKKGIDGGTSNSKTARMVSKILRPQIELIHRDFGQGDNGWNIIFCDFSFGYIHGMTQASEYLTGEDDNTLNLFATIELVFSILFGRKFGGVYHLFAERNSVSSLDYENGFEKGKQYMIDIVKAKGEYELEELDINLHWYNSVLDNYLG